MTGAATRNILLRLQFVGTAYSGWQRQSKDRSVQAVIEDAIAGATGEPSSLVGCSRTDAGVHAEDYIANFKTHSGIPPTRFAPAIQSHLPRDILIRSSRVVPFSFNSRKCSYSKTYRYQIYCGFTPFNCSRWYQTSESLDLEALSRAAELLVGGHDFGNFCVTKSLKRDNQCNIEQATWSRRGRKLYFKVTGDRFLHKMVRFLVGTQLQIATGKMALEDLRQMLQCPGEFKAKHAAPPDGLYLEKVRFMDRLEE